MLRGDNLQKNYILPFSVLASVPFIMVLGNSMLIPVLPQMKEALNLTQLQTGLVITMFSVPAGITIPLAGLLSDRISRRWIIAGALTIYAAGGLIAGLGAVMMKSYAVIMAGRVLQGIGAAGTAPIAMALSSDIFTSNERSKVLGMLESSNGMGKVISPILGSIIGLLAWWAVFFLFPILCVPIALGMLFLVKEPKANKKPQAFKEYFKDLRTIFKEKGVSLVTAFLAGAIVLFVLFGVLFYLSEHLEERYKIEGVLKGLILAIPVLAMTVTSYVTGLVAQKKAKLHKPLVVIGTGILAISMGIAAIFNQNTYVMVAALVLAGIGTGMVLPCLNTMITSSCNIDERGMITSLYGGVRFFGVALGPPVFGLLMDKSVAIMFVVPAILTAIVALLNLFLCHEDVLKLKPDQGSENSGGQNKGQLGQGKEKASSGILRDLLITAKLPKKPQLRPTIKIKEEIIKNIMEDLQPQIDKSLKSELSEQEESLKQEITNQVEDELKNAISVKIETDKNE